MIEDFRSPGDEVKVSVSDRIEAARVDGFYGIHAR